MQRIQILERPLEQNLSELMKKILLIILIAFFSTSFHSSAEAQRTPQAANSRQKKQAKDEIASPEAVTLTTKDFVSLSAMYYPGPESKETPAVIITHDWGGDRMAMAGLAEYLQKELRASVIVPDLRGHGQSTSMTNGSKKISYKDFKKAEVMTTMADIEACKKFLMTKNNKGLLNIEMLTLVAVGETAKIAVDWSISDWSWAPTPGGDKQGQDVKLISLVSPIQRIEGLSIKQSLKAPLMTGKGMTPLPLQIMWAHDNNRSFSNAKAIYNTLDKARKKSGKDSLSVAKIEKSSNSPTGLLTDRNSRMKCFQKISNEINTRIIGNKDILVWQNRDSSK